MGRKKQHKTKTLEFELDGIEEAYAPAPGWRHGGQAEGRRLEVEIPPDLEEPFEPQANIWIMERRARGAWAGLRRWLAGKKKKGKRRRR